jgi:hypothetical protein
MLQHRASSYETSVHITPEQSRRSEQLITPTIPYCINHHSIIAAMLSPLLFLTSTAMYSTWKETTQAVKQQAVKGESQGGSSVGRPSPLPPY